MLVRWLVARTTQGRVLWSTVDRSRLLSRHQCSRTESSSSHVLIHIFLCRVCMTVSTLGLAVSVWSVHCVGWHLQRPPSVARPRTHVQRKSYCVCCRWIVLGSLATASSAGPLSVMQLACRPARLARYGSHLVVFPQHMHQIVSQHIDFFSSFQSVLNRSARAGELPVVSTPW